jgi:hypothetical protein
MADPEGMGLEDHGSRGSVNVRLAVVGTPRTGNTWVRRVLSDSLLAKEVAVFSPGQISASSFNCIDPEPMR